jgi:hypothetical protein
MMVGVGGRLTSPGMVYDHGWNIVQLKHELAGIQEYIKRYEA